MHKRRGYGLKIATERRFVGGGAVGTQENGGKSERRRRLHVEIDKTHDEGPSPYPYSAEMSDPQDVTAKKSNCRRASASRSTCLSCPSNHVIFTRTRTVHSEQRKGLEPTLHFHTSCSHDGSRATLPSRLVTTP